MSDNSVGLFRKLTQELFNTENLDYKRLIAGLNETYTLPLANEKPNDIDIGALANLTEYNRLLATWLLDQMDITTAVGDRLDYLGSFIYNIYRENGESDATYRTRIRETIFGVKETKWAILDDVDPYNGSGSPTYPFIKEFDDLQELQAYSDYTYTEQYRRWNSSTFPEEVLPAYAGGQSVTGVDRFFFALYMLDVTSDDDKKIVYDLVDKASVAGVEFTIYFLTEDIYGS